MRPFRLASDTLIDLDNVTGITKVLEGRDEGRQMFGVQLYLSGGSTLTVDLASETDDISAESARRNAEEYHEDLVRAWTGASKRLPDDAEPIRAGGTD